MLSIISGATTNFRGIPSSSTIKNVQLHHPHLQLTKSYILVEMDKQNIPFVNDSSNQTLDYDRNKIRAWLADHPLISIDVYHQCNIH